MTGVLATYRRLLRLSKEYPSSRQKEIIAAIREEYRANIDLQGEARTRAVRAGEMELKRLKAWIPTARALRSGRRDVDIDL